MNTPCSGIVPGAELPTGRDARPRASAGHQTDERTARPCPHDIIFAGAGLSALSLAVRLAALPDPPRMLLVDQRHESARDRTWCHWQLHPTPFDAAVTHRWHNWLVRTSTVGTPRREVGTPYVRIPSDRFYDVAMGQLSTSPHVTFLRGVSVESIEELPDFTAVHFCDGRRIESSWVVDSRPPQNDKAPWRQIFRGLELHSPEAKLDTATVTLMDFQSAGPEGIRFFYVLPLDKHTALVEDTWLVPRGKSPTFTDEQILHYARNNLGSAGWQIRHREEGNLPMDLAPAVQDKNRIIPWGTAAGAVRASSGYAFSRIQRASERMAHHWSQHGRPDPNITHESPLLAWMDRVFLRVMDRHPERVPGFFTRMFDRVPPEALARFLESEPRPADILRVMCALPPAPFLAAALR
jgi:lycopene beta-cyclase